MDFIDTATFMAAVATGGGGHPAEFAMPFASEFLPPDLIESSGADGIFTKSATTR